MHTSPWQIQPGATIHALLRLRGGMPASAPRIKMPANNRMHSSAALRTTDMWSNVIGVCMFVWVGGWVVGSACVRARGLFQAHALAMLAPER